MIVKLWTPEEDAILRRMMEDGATYQQTTDALPDRTIAGVKARAYKLNCGNTTAEGRWTGKDDATLRQMWADGFTALKIAERVRMSHATVRRRIERLKLPTRKSPARAIGECWAENDKVIERSARQATQDFERHYKNIANRRGWRVWSYAA